MFMSVLMGCDILDIFRANVTKIVNFVHVVLNTNLKNIFEFSVIFT